MLITDIDKLCSKRDYKVCSKWDCKNTRSANKSHIPTYPKRSLKMSKSSRDMSTLQNILATKSQSCICMVYGLIIVTTRVSLCEKLVLVFFTTQSQETKSELLPRVLIQRPKGSLFLHFILIFSPSSSFLSSFSSLPFQSLPLQPSPFSFWRKFEEGILQLHDGHLYCTF